MVQRISAVDLKQKLDDGEPIQLVAALDEYAFKTKHIPGSLYLADPKEAVRSMDKERETIVYCSGPSCINGPFVSQFFIRNGFTRVRLFSGGLEVWEEAGFPLVKGRGF